MKKQMILFQSLFLFSTSRLFCPGNAELRRTLEEGSDGDSPAQTRRQEVAARNALAQEMAQSRLDLSRKEILRQERDSRRELRIEKILHREYLAMRPEHRVLYEKMTVQERAEYRQMSSFSRKQYLERKWEEALRQIIGRQKEYPLAVERAMSPEERVRYISAQKMSFEDLRKFNDELGPVLHSEGEDDD